MNSTTGIVKIESMQVKKYLFIFFISTALFSCRHKAANADVATENKGTPVTITAIVKDTISDDVFLNATSAFLTKSYITANAEGYIQEVNINLGQYVSARRLLFTIKTKEAAALGNAITEIDTSFHFNGVLPLYATSSGYVTELNHQKGDYVQDGEQLAAISDAGSFVFILHLPYELKKYLPQNKRVEIKLPDGKKLTGIISSEMPMVDSVSQTQKILIKVNAPGIPENLIAQVRILKSLRLNANTLPKQAVLTDETQSKFWVMKLIDDSTAVKIPIVKGIENNEMVEILSPSFLPDDKILLKGNYGLPDTAKVVITQ